MGSHKVVSKGYVFTKNSQIASIGVIFTSTYHKKQLNPWPNSSASRVVNYSWPSFCQGDMEAFVGDPNTRGHQTNLRKSHSKSSLGNFQHQYLAELLVNVYMQLSFDGEKYVLLLCAWKVTFLNQVTYIEYVTMQPLY